MNCQTSYESLQHVLHSCYLPLRERALAARECTAESGEDTGKSPVFQFSERFLQILWNEQRFSGEMSSTDGKRVEVLVPGTWNVERGPDFRNAVIKLDGRIRTGDVEVHKTVSDWRSHGHDQDPEYDNVILHVVWGAPSTAAGGNAGPTCFALAGFLDRPWRTLLEEFRTEIYPYARQVSPGSCALRWAMTDDDRLVRLLRIAGFARLEDKTLRIHRTAIAKGFDQALYEGLFEALGYKANRRQFRALAQELPLAFSELRQYK